MENCNVNYAGVCLHLVEKEKEIEKRNLLASQMECEIDKKTNLINALRRACLNQSVSNQRMQIEFNKKFRKHKKEIQSLKLYNSNLICENTRLRSHKLYWFFGGMLFNYLIYLLWS